MTEARTATTLIVVASLLATLLGVPAAAQAQTEYQAPQPQVDPPVPGEEAPPADPPDARTGQPFLGEPPVWPEAGMAEVDLASAAVPAGRLPVRVGPSEDLGAAPDRVRVQVIEPVVGPADRVVVQLARADGAAESSRVSVELDYSRFRHAFGGDWSNRLGLVAVPACALSTPDDPGCRGEPLESRNDPDKGLISAEVTLPGTGGALLALDAAPSGPTGDYAATPLQPSSTWSAGGATGDFSWSYPIRVPPSLGGPAPSIALSYSSASVDGRMAASNNQPSMIGEGFDWSPGYIERRYLPCADDKASGGNTPTGTGDLCWATANAVLSLNGRAAELLRGPDGRWHARSEDGSRIQLHSGQANGDDNGEYWIVTTQDGTQYWFGRNRLPGWTAGRPETGSVFTVPVYGNHPDEPCHRTAFADSWCNQAYRWNLDYVVDPLGNTMSVWYKQETGLYAREFTPTEVSTYTRAGYVDRIDYGTRSDTAYGTAPMQVDMVEADRCQSNCASHTAASWPDTAWDLECTGSPCYVVSPTFWTTNRLTKIVTKVWGGTGYRNVEEWTLTHSFPDPGDGTRAGLWLERISHTGLVGTPASVPDVTFLGVQRPNRVDRLDHSPPMNWWRVAQITTETGGTIGVTYSGADCVAGSRMPSQTALHDNRLRCYPVRWKPEGSSSAVLDFFHKYVVTTVTEESDATNDPVHTVNAYEYLGSPAWHYTDDDGLIKPEDKTWSVWRGYEWVRTITGDPGEQTRVDTRYFRGMHGDKLPNNLTRSITLPAVGSYAPAVPDEDAYAGMVREAITYNGPTGVEVSATVSQPWQSAPTATRSINQTTVHARFATIGAGWIRTALDGSRPPRITGTRSTFDDHGLAVRGEDLGDLAVAGDEQCTLTDYARNQPAWLMSYAFRSRVFAVDCTKAAAGGLTEADLISDDRTYFDGADAVGTSPTRGVPTRTEQLKAWNPSTQTPTYATTASTAYDPYGRVTSTTDVKGNTTTTAYTPAAGGPVTGTTVTNPLGWRTTSTVEPAWGQPLSTEDPNARRTEFAYDGLGRLLSVWLPGRDRSSFPAAPSLRFAYVVRRDGPTATATSALTAAGGYATSYQLLDGLGRVRQTQAPEGGTQGGRIITDTFYDSAGRAWKTYGGYLANGAPSAELFVPDAEAAIPSVTRTVFDGAARPTVSVFESKGTEKWRTTTNYGGDRSQVTPPRGGTATTMIVDADGHTVELRQHHGTTPTGAYDATTYAYNAKNQLVRVTDPAGNRWEYTFDLRGRQTRTSDPDRGVTTDVYNDAGELTSTTDARGVTLSYSYDSLGRKTALRQGSTTRAEWSYDSYQDTASGTMRSALGQLTRSTRYEQGNPYTREVTGFDLATHQPTGIRYTIPPAETGLAGQYEYRFTYKPNGAPATTRLPDLDGAGGLPAETLTVGYNGLGQPATLSTNLTTSGALSATYVNGTSYTRYGEPAVIGYRYDGGRSVDVALHYEEGTRRLQRQWATRETSPSTVADVWYAHDAAGNVTKISDVAANDRQCFGYDYLRRLTRAWTPASGDCSVAPTTGGLGGPAPYWLDWTFDQTGNRLSQTEHTGTGDRTTGYMYPGAGSPQPHTLRATTGSATGSYTYDLAGNTITRPSGTGTQTLTWDPEGHLASTADATGTTSYLYEPDGDRLIRRDPAGRTLYLPGQELRWTAGGGAKSTTRHYSLAGRTVATRTSAGLTWLIGDHQGTASTAVAATGQTATTRRQTPYGVPRGAAVTWPNDRGFVGGVRDNTGLVHLGAREYDAASGRFLSVDPLINHDDPQQMHGYAYANNTPVTGSDPDGRCIRLDDRDAPCIGSPNYQQRQEAFEKKQRERQTKPRARQCGPPLLDPSCRDNAWVRDLADDPPPCAGVWFKGDCLTAGQWIRQGNIDNGSTKYALDHATRIGMECRLDRHQIVCFGPSPIPSFGFPQSVGDVLFFPGTPKQFQETLNKGDDDRRKVAQTCDSRNRCLDPNLFGPDLRGHEAAHSDQWAKHDSIHSYIAAFGGGQIDSKLSCPGLSWGACNPFEVAANPFKGRYWSPPVVGPDGNFQPAEDWPDLNTVERLMDQYRRTGAL
jgi:RHS repeat-associated protein